MDLSIESEFCQSWTETCINGPRNQFLYFDLYMIMTPVQHFIQENTSQNGVSILPPYTLQ